MQQLQSSACYLRLWPPPLNLNYPAPFSWSTSRVLCHKPSLKIWCGGIPPITCLLRVRWTMEKSKTRLLQGWWPESKPCLPTNFKPISATTPVPQNPQHSCQLNLHLRYFQRQRSTDFLSPKCILVLPPFPLTWSFLFISHWPKSMPSPVTMLGPLWDSYSGNSLIPSLLRIPCSLPIPSTSLQFYLQLCVYFIFNLKYHRWSYFNKWKEIKHFRGLQMLSQVWQPLYSPRNHA